MKGRRFDFSLIHEFIGEGLWLMVGPVHTAGLFKRQLKNYYMNDSEAYMNSIANTFTKEPVFNCPQCKAELQTDWVDNGFGPYSVQASPYGCECGWHEMGCKECINEKCFSWIKCQGRALIKLSPAKGAVNYNMNNNLDPNAPKGQEEVKEQEGAGAAADTEAQNEQATEESAEEGNTEG